MAADMNNWADYQTEVIRIMEIAEWTPQGIQSNDWTAWKENHFDEGDTPAEGYQQHMDHC